MEQRERRLSAAGKERYFPKVDWFEGLYDSMPVSFMTGALACLPFMIIWKLLQLHGPYQWLPWLPADGTFVVWWIGLPVALLTLAATYGSDLLWQHKRKRSACSSVLVERHHVVDAIMVRETEHGTPAYFVLTDDDRVFFSIRGGDVYDNGWDANPVSVRKSDRVHRVYERTLNGSTLSELETEFSGEMVPPDKCYTTDFYWDEIALNPHVSWGEIIEKFELEPLEAVSPV